MRILSFGYNLLRAKIAHRQVPFQVTFNLTDRCNLKCDYCYVGYHSRRKEELSTEQWLGIIDELASRGTVKINLSGGEPLLRKDIGTIISRIREHSIDCYVNTNGIMVPRKIDQLEGISCLAVSLDGREEVNDPVRGTGSFEKAVRALEVGHEHGIPLQIACVLGRHNLGEIEFLMSLAGKFHAKLNIMTQLPVRQNGTIAGELSHAREQYLDTVRKIIDWKKQGKPITYSPRAWQNFLDWPESAGKDFMFDKDASRPGSVKCYAGTYYCVIDTNGDLYPCCSLIGLVPAPNVVNDGFASAFSRIRNHPCAACSFPHNAEMNTLFALDPNTILNLLKVYFN